MNVQDRLMELYAELSTLTNELCGQCTPPYHCCELAGCQRAAAWAKNVYGLTLERKNETETPFLTEQGCSVKPHHRLVCTIFLCREAQEKAPLRYQELRRDIAMMEAARFKL